MSLGFGHGFLPRVGSENHFAIDRCVGAPSLWNDSLDLPWAIVDAAWAERHPTDLEGLRANGTKLLGDTSGWRFRFAKTLATKKYAEASWAPADAVDPHEEHSVSALVRRSLHSQAALGVDAYLVPGFVPTEGAENLLPCVASIISTLETFTDVPAKPFVLTLGGHSTNLDFIHAALNEIPAWVSAIYVLVTPTDLRKVSPTRLDVLMAVYMHAEQLGFEVIVGRGGAITPALRAFGVSAGDAGLGTGERFDQSAEKRGRSETSQESKRTGGPRSRIYLPQIDRSVNTSEAQRLLAVPAVAEELLTCRLPCHRFQGGDPLAHAREHSLWTRVDEAQRVSATPRAGRVEVLRDALRRKRSTLTRINDALLRAGEAPVDTTALDNKLTWLSRATAQSAAA
jgi:hypothetical protein